MYEILDEEGLITLESKPHDSILQTAIDDSITIKSVEPQV